MHHSGSSTVNSAEQTSIFHCLMGISNLNKTERPETGIKEDEQEMSGTYSASQSIPKSGNR